MKDCLLLGGCLLLFVGILVALGLALNRAMQIFGLNIFHFIAGMVILFIVILFLNFFILLFNGNE